MQDLVEKLQGKDPVREQDSIPRSGGGGTALEGNRTSHDGPGTFNGLKRDEKGGITYHGATSFFQIPAPAGGDDSGSLPAGSGSQDVAGGEGGERKERLVSNAWQQRAMETFSEMPVSN